ncbi:hypothetical protein IAD21_04600 [Abditibacteriota bacterium]|nr:hypothetical protein IAD21_04600 [Abditibacteriota bacterium]
MSYLYQIICDRCPHTSEVQWPLWACYSLASGYTLEIAQRLCWCHNCNGVRIAESLAGIEHIERLQNLPIIKNAYDGEPKTWSEDEKKTVLDYVRYPRLNHLYNHFTHWKRWDVRQSVIMKNSLALHHDWLIGRTMLPCCLTCGGTEFLPFSADDQEVPASALHPHCGGAISFIPLRKIREKRYLWSSEGEPIGIG